MSAPVSPVPPRDGVAASCLVLPAGPWPDLLAFLQARFPHVAASWAQRLAAGQLWDDGGQPLPSPAPYRAGQRIWYFRQVAGEVTVPFEAPILFRDDRLLVVDKPHFLACMPGGRHLQQTVLTRLRQLPGLAAVSPIHRLDRETAGVLVFCVDPAWRGAYQRLFEQQQVSKEYEAIAPWPPVQPLPLDYTCRLQERAGEFVMSVVPGEPNSHTRISLIRQQGGWAHYRLQPSSGKKHQLRAHMAALGVPIRHDPWYPVFRHDKADDDFSQPLALLARSIAFTDPVDGRPRHFCSQRQLPWPEEQA